MLPDTLGVCVFLAPGSYSIDPYQRTTVPHQDLAPRQVPLSNTLWLWMGPCAFVSSGLRLVVQTLILAVPGIFTAAGLTFLLFLMYAILGVTLLKGKMYKCNNPICDVPRKIPLDECSTPEKCDKGGGRWVLHPRNFNNCGSALLTLFEVATLEQWAHEIMYPAIDAVSSTESPVRDYNPAMALFFVVVIISGSFFMLNIFVGVVLYTFNEVFVLFPYMPYFWYWHAMPPRAPHYPWTC